MESSVCKGLFQEVEDKSFINQWIMNSYDSLGATQPVSGAFTDDNHLQHSSLYDDGHQHPIKSPTSQPEGSCIIESTPNPEPHSNFSASKNTHAAVASSFLNPPSPPVQFTLDRFDQQPVWNKYGQSINGQRATRKIRTPLAQDHVIAERKRREELSQKFIALSAVVPRLKKTDKASVLADAIKYLKHLQERVNTLEVQSHQTKVKSVKCVVLVKKSELLTNEKFKPNADGLEEKLPEIEVRVCDMDVLIRVHCDNKIGVIDKVFSEISMLNLTISNTSVLSFGNLALHITIIAQMDVKCCLSVKELVATLRARFMSFM